ncbi:MAG: nucleotidyltransferase domain-containing protein [Chloroflexi bacterium]|nr:nucleotidyltransferase domain-containing protein [Chloroflexota bacterium]
MSVEIRYDLLKSVLADQPYPLLFATISGAHLYGFPSPDSDYDLRGIHLLPLNNILGLEINDETIEDTRVQQGLEIDLVTHDVKKFLLMLLKKNGYVLEQIFSPLIVYALPEHDELKHLAKNAIIRHHHHHYFGFAKGQWELFEKENPRRVKPLLYTFRVLLTGIHLMRTGEIEAHLPTLNEIYPLPYIPELIARKLSGVEKSTLDTADVTFFQAEYQRLQRELDSAFQNTHLPEFAPNRDEINDFLVRLRLKYHVE